MSGRKMVTVHLYGTLAQKFGREFRLFVASPAEAVRLLEANFPGQFYRFVRDRAFLIKRGPTKKKSLFLSPEMLGAGLGGEDLHVIPVAAGASKGWAAVILGTVLIGAAIILSGGTLAAPLAGLSTTAFSIAGASVTWGTIASVGLGLALVGISQFLVKTPVADLSSNSADSSSSTQNMFNGPVNVTKQGGCVPVIYGRALCGTVVASGGIHLDVVQVPTSPANNPDLSSDVIDALNALGAS